MKSHGRVRLILKVLKMSYEICAGGGIESRFCYDVEQTDFQQKAHFETIVRTAESEQQ